MNTRYLVFGLMCAIVTVLLVKYAIRGKVAPYVTSSAKNLTPASALIGTTGKHHLFSHKDGNVNIEINEKSKNLSYTVSIVDSKGSLSKGPWQLHKQSEWFVYVDEPNIWVFDGNEEVRLVHLEVVEECRGLSDKASQEFPEILKTAPQEFLNRLPEKMRGNKSDAQQGNAPDASDGWKF